ncbi:MAG: MotA/TolQ/ExbB proton channel family protein [Alphaproteobacteria bacterium]|nr:MotA/TolQ/ExbB proton channel family protein [Alphaproteobacteria bacterium]
MSKSSVLGIILGWGIVFATIRIATPDISMFWDTGSFLLVIIGPYFSMLMGYKGSEVNLANKKWLSIFKNKGEAPASYKDEVGRFVRWAYITQKNGLQGLENDALSSVGEDDQFLKYGVELVISGYTGNEVREILKEAAYSAYQREGKPAEILTNIGAYAPAFGMAGTLIGLVVMLANMGADASAIGSGMAVALITTFYGVLSARLIYLPAGIKLTARSDDALFRNLLVAESLVLLAERKSPRYIQDKLNAFLDPSQHFLIDRDMER